MIYNKNEIVDRIRNTSKFALPIANFESYAINSLPEYDTHISLGGYKAALSMVM